jgi:ribosomal protein L11 methyltransferase
MCQEMLTMVFDSKRVLDMGCGTGILAILASKLNAAACTAIDTEEWAVANTAENCTRNNVNTITTKQGNATSLGQQLFDVVLANINKNVLLADMNKYVSVLKKNGALLLSGFFDTDADELTNYGTTIGLTLKHKTSKNNWCMLHFTKN